MCDAPPPPLEPARHRVGEGGVGSTSPLIIV